MIDWFLRKKPNTIIYWFLSPLLLIFIVRFTPFYGSPGKVTHFLFFIFWVQMVLYSAFDVALFKWLFAMKKNRTLNQWPYLISILISFGLITYLFAQLVIFEKLDFGSSALLFLTIYTVTDIVRKLTITRLLISLEQKREVPWQECLPLTFKLINPLVSIWTLHERLTKLHTRKGDY